MQQAVKQNFLKQWTNRYWTKHSHFFDLLLCSNGTVDTCSAKSHS